ncbi:hypothetical protein CspeluHIS016_0101220 [Cutaneotrichosporon spelunceum]|uniref:AMP-dependent synthetase/ligase domain-containing protein n=1 Tax=Cutaneotrichosporon spelunceum TaxID=1672016 RepID=A0AAD3TNF7_9TREE|nr:hypothetical protein CspeluHIS016_0101220 [Cutaneotrichosporon spelunceum]
MVIEVDNLTLLLLAVLVVLLLYQRLSAPQSLVHSLQLGGQAAPAAVRQPGESAVYRAWATGQGTPLQVRPASAVKTVDQAAHAPPPSVLPGKPLPPIRQRYILDTPLTPEALAEVARLVPLGLRALFPRLASEEVTPVAVLLPPSPSTSLPTLLLALASEPRHPLVVLDHPRHLPSALNGKEHPVPALIVAHAAAAGDLTNLPAGVDVLLVGDPEGKVELKARRWEEIWDAAESAPAEQPMNTWSDTFGWFHSDGEVLLATHMTMTAGIAGIMALFPADKRPGPRDIVASTMSLNTPFGLALALAAVWCGSGLRLIGPSGWDTEADPNAELALLAADDQPLPTVLFATPPYHAVLVAHTAHALRFPLGRLASTHKLHGIRKGWVGREGWADALVAGARKGVLGGLVESLRAVLVVGDVNYGAVSRSHAVLSLPLTRLTVSPVSAGPLFASHFYDLQSPVVPDVYKPTGGNKAHTGPPASNVEVVLRGVHEPLAEEGEVAGRVWVRGPAVLERQGAVEGWTDAGISAAVSPNGTFVVV